MLDQFRRSTPVFESFHGSTEVTAGNSLVFNNLTTAEVEPTMPQVTWRMEYGSILGEANRES